MSGDATRRILAGSAADAATLWAIATATSMRKAMPTACRTISPPGRCLRQIDAARLCIKRPDPRAACVRYDGRPWDEKRNDDEPGLCSCGGANRDSHFRRHHGRPGPDRRDLVDYWTGCVARHPRKEYAC